MSGSRRKHGTIHEPEIFRNMDSYTLAKFQGPNDHKEKIQQSGKRTPVDNQRADVSQRLLFDIEIFDEDEFLGGSRGVRRREDVRVQLVEIRIAFADEVGGILLDLFAHLELGKLQDSNGKGNVLFNCQRLQIELPYHKSTKKDRREITTAGTVQINDE